MINRNQNLGIAFVLCSIYGLLFYFIFSHHQKLDFSAFYLSPYALKLGENPYGDFLANFLNAKETLPANLNPPIVLWALSPLTRLSFATALLIWTIFSVLLGVLSVAIAVRIAFSAKFLQKHYLILYLTYFAFFPTLINVATLQFGTILFFFIVVGYYFYLNNRDYYAGIFWGIIIATKFFPGLLFFYVLKQGRFKVFWVMLVTLIIACFIPLLIYGRSIYVYYFSMLSHVFWYGDGWNASIYGFLFRLFIDPQNLQHIILIEILHVFLCFILLLWYLQKMGGSSIGQANHQPFCLTLTVMLLMSPLGWVYYFPILILPLILTWFVALDEERYSIKTMLAWLLCFFLINFPLDYVKIKNMTPNGFIRISLYSTYFYGLLLLTYLLGKRKEIYGKNELITEEAKSEYLSTMIIIFAFGLSVPALCFIMRLF